LFQLV